MDKNKLRYAILKLRDEKKNPFIELKGQVPEEDILEQTKFLSCNGLLESMVWADNTVHIWGSVSLEGEKYLVENSGLAKAYALAKEVKIGFHFGAKISF